MIYVFRLKMADFIGKVVESDYGKEVKIGLKDKKILATLSINVRLSPSEIGRIVGLSKDAVRYRINQLEKKGIIRGSLVVLNPSKVGYYLHTLLLKFENLSEKKENKIINFFALHPFGVWFGNCSGQWDFVFQFIAKDIKHLDRIIQKIKWVCGENLKDYEDLTVFNLVKYVDLQDDFYKNLGLRFKFEKKDTSFAKEIKKGIIDFDYDKQIKLDLNDAKILRALSENASAPISDISKKTGIPRDTIVNRISKMINNNLIIAFNPVINITYLKFHLYIIFFHLVNLTKEKEFLNYLSVHPFVAYGGKTTGKYEAQIFLAVKSPMHMHEIMKDFRRKFSDTIGSYEPLLVIKDYKYTFLPKGVFSLF